MYSLGWNLPGQVACIDHWERILAKGSEQIRKGGTQKNSGREILGTCDSTFLPSAVVLAQKSSQPGAPYLRGGLFGYLGLTSAYVFLAGASSVTWGLWWQSVVVANTLMSASHRRECLPISDWFCLKRGCVWPPVSVWNWPELQLLSQVKLPLPLCRCLVSSHSKPRSSSYK